jgi:glycosyltransferase involved in cell wall biosynthesis
LVLGIPVVATDVGGIGEIVTDGREAVLVPAGEPDRLAAALIALVDDPARRREMAAVARTRGDALDVGRAIRDVEAVYREELRP